jgi:sugar phosphate isomerase/epimerase
MRVDYIKSLWGMSGSLESDALKGDLDRIVTAGYDGFEFDLPTDDGISMLCEARSDYDLKCFVVFRTSGPDHLASFEQLLERAAALEPDLVTSHSAQDSMRLSEALHFFEGALEVQRRLDVNVAHETHRQTPLYTPWQTAAIVTRLPELRITADYSHWCCVAERMLADQEDNIAACRPNVAHIHGRVGYPGGPQVNDPRAPENHAFLERHEHWWTQILQFHQAAGTPSISFDPEFGPGADYYMHVLPYTQEPVADLWEVCNWMSDRLRALAQAVLGPSAG